MTQMDRTALSPLYIFIVYVHQWLITLLYAFVDHIPNGMHITHITADTVAVASAQPASNLREWSWAIFGYPTYPSIGDSFLELDTLR